MRFKYLILFIVLFLTYRNSYSQDRYGFHHYQVILYAGTSHFFGDLGGADKKGSHFSPADLNLGTTGYSLGAGVIRKFNNRFSMRANLIEATVRGSDSYTTDPFRKDRNLSFRSTIEELSVTADVNIFTFNKSQKNTHNLLVFAGFGVFRFNPQANYRGKWYDLQPLGTEGQGLVDGKSKYKKISYNIPFGLGYNFNVSERQKIGLILTMRKTFTDYIDDVSTNYYDNNKLTEANGEIAGILADRNLERDSGGAKNSGDGRGNPKINDNFAFLQISYSFRFYAKKREQSFPFTSFHKDKKCFKW